MAGTGSKIKSLVGAIIADDRDAVEATVTRIAGKHRALAPLVFLVGALMMIFPGLRLLITNWRLLLVEVLPAMWIWANMLNLRMHLFRGQSFADWHGASAAALMLGIVVVTIATYHLNVVFAFAVASPAAPRLRAAFSRALRNWGQSVVLGSIVGGALAVSTVVVPRWGLGWYSLSLSVVIALMMVTYVSLPARLLGITPSTAARRDRLAASAVSGAVGAAISTPAYLTGRLGILILGSRRLFVLGVILVCVGFSLQAGANGAVNAVKMSVKLVASREPTAS